MSDWHSNPLPGARQSRTYADTSDSIDEDCDTTTSSPHRISSQLQQDGKASLTPRQLSEFVISNPVSKIPPFEYYPRQVRSSLKHISTNVSLSKTLFTTGEAVTGKIEVSCTKENEHCLVQVRRNHSFGTVKLERICFLSATKLFPTLMRWVYKKDI